MEKQFVPYELAVKLKELGFDEPCLGFYNDYRELHMNHTYDLFYLHLKAPLWQQAFDWFSQKHGLFAVIDITITDEWFYSIYNLKSKRNSEIKPTEEEYFKTHGQAIFTCLEKLIELITPQLEDK